MKKLTADYNSKGYVVSILTDNLHFLFVEAASPIFLWYFRGKQSI